MPETLIGRKYVERERPETVWIVSGIVDGHEGTLALLVSRDGNRFREVRVETLLDLGRYHPISVDA